jgi:hypothetical protein
VQSTQRATGGRASIVLGFVTIAVAVAAVWWLLSTIWATLVNVQAPVGAALIAGPAALAGAIASALIGQRSSRQRDIEQELRKRKAEVYEGFLTFFFRLAGQTKPGATPVSPEDMSTFFEQFAPKALIWAGADFLVQYQDLQRQLVALAGGGDDAVRQQLLLLDRFIRTLRADLGHEDKAVPPGTLVGFFVTDAPKYLLDQSREPRAK